MGSQLSRFSNIHKLIVIIGYYLQQHSVEYQRLTSMGRATATGSPLSSNTTFSIVILWLSKQHSSLVPSCKSFSNCTTSLCIYMYMSGKKQLLLCMVHVQISSGWSSTLAEPHKTIIIYSNLIKLMPRHK